MSYLKNLPEVVAAVYAGYSHVSFPNQQFARLYREMGYIGFVREMRKTHQRNLDLPSHCS